MACCSRSCASATDVSVVIRHSRLCLLELVPITPDAAWCGLWHHSPPTRLEPAPWRKCGVICNASLCSLETCRVASENSHRMRKTYVPATSKVYSRVVLCGRVRGANFLTRPARARHGALASAEDDSVAGEEPMVLTRPQHHNRRGMPAGITFGGGGCALACCDPRSRQEVATRRLPLPYECRVAFLMGCSRAVPRLTEDCAPSLRRMPVEVVRRIIELCTRCAHVHSTQHALACSPYPPAPRAQRGAARHHSSGAAFKRQR